MSRNLLYHAAAIGPADEVFNYPTTIEWLQATVITSGSAGSRQIEIDFMNAAGTVIFSISAGAVQAASLTRAYTASPELVSGAAFVAANIAIAIPRITIPAAGKIRIRDSAAIDVPTDTISFYAGTNVQ